MITLILCRSPQWMTALVYLFSNHDLMNSRLLACNQFFSFSYIFNSSRHERQFCVWPIHKQTLMFTFQWRIYCTFNLTSIPNLQSSPKAAKWQREAFRLQREGILSEVHGQSLWGNPVAMRQIVFSRHLTWIPALPPYQSGPPCPLHSHNHSPVFTFDSRGGCPSKLFL